ncbi:pirin family protein [Clostridium beijerinckii]|nr:pirin family protein [Clostridium beijerinckii]
MLKKIYNKNMGKSNLGWINSSFHFSFSEYYNPSNINFGKLRVINDDLIQAKTGFPMHPHNDMEIISYVIDGKITHKDSMGNIGELSRGEVQYMSAGTGVYHSEYNLGDEDLRLLQIWIYPDKKDYMPNYGEKKFNWSDRENKWLHMVSSIEGNAPVKIHQDVNIYAIYLEKNNEESLNVEQNRQAYLVQIEGSSIINGIELNEKDALEIVEENIKIKAKENSHFLVLEMKKE